MNQLFNKLERKFGRYAVHDLIKYVVILYAAGAAINIAMPGVYIQYLALNFDSILHDFQVWRLFTFLLGPSDVESGTGMILSILFLLIEINLFLLFGRALEQAWGAFRFNLYFFSGYLLNILAAIILYFSPLHVSLYYEGLHYIYLSMFLAFALINPNMELMLYFVLPIKVKWLAILDAVLMIYQIFNNVRQAIICIVSYQWYERGGIYLGMALAIVVAMLNFLIFFFSTRDYRRISPGEIHRRREYRRKTRPQNIYTGGARHRCAICGRTELDAPELDFRYCSKCEGNYEYCSDHLFTHQHVKR